MTDDNGNDRSQKTVAELLALHGNSTESGRRRQRRSAEREPEPGDDERRDISDTAPQAIINRIHEEEGPDVGAEEGARQVQGHAQPAAPPDPTPAPDPQPQASQRQAPQRQAPQRQAPQRQAPSPQQASQPLRAQPQQRQAPEAKAAEAKPPESKAPEAKAPRPPAPEQPSTPQQQPPQQQPPQQASQPLRAQPQQPQQPPPSKQSQPAARPWGPRRGPLRPARRPEPEPSTDQFPALERPPESSDRAEGMLDTEGRPGSQAGPQVPSGAPPAGLSKWRKRRGQQQQPAAETDVGIVPPVPPDVGEPAGSQVERALSGPPDTVAGGGAQTGEVTPSYGTGEQPLPVDDYADYEFDPYSERYVHDYADDYAEGYGSDTAEDSDYADDYADDYAENYGEDYADDYGDYADEFDYVDDPYQELDELDEPEYLDEDSEFDEFEELEDEAVSPARQWVALAGQLALGVVAGAGVWLGFSWLWSEFPSAALIAALIVTVGVVWVVRKVRHADDTQTTVLAVLVGLIVTVSPAALLLLDR